MVAQPPAAAAWPSSADLGSLSPELAPADELWAPPASLRIGREVFQLRHGPPGTPPALALAGPPVDDHGVPPPGTLTLREWPAEPQRIDALFYPQWQPGFARVLGRKFALDLDFSRRTVTWWWPHREGLHLAALWELSVLGTLQALALHAGGLLLHGAAIGDGGQAIAVTGPSGAGKTTFAQRFPGQVLHDDVIALAPDAASPTGWAVWSQDGWRAPQRPLPPALPLQRIGIFDENRAITQARPVLAPDALSLLAAQTYFAGGEATPVLMAHLAALASAVPLCRFSHCLADPADRVLRLLREGS